MVTIKCPICSWTHKVPPIDSRINSGTLADVFGPGVMLLQATNQRSTKAEEIIEKHLKTHTMSEWVNAIEVRDRSIKSLNESLVEAVAKAVH